MVQDALDELTARRARRAEIERPEAYVVELYDGPPADRRPVVRVSHLSGTEVSLVHGVLNQVRLALLPWGVIVSYAAPPDPTAGEGEARTQ